MAPAAQATKREYKQETVGVWKNFHFYSKEERQYLMDVALEYLNAGNVTPQKVLSKERTDNPKVWNMNVTYSDEQIANTMYEMICDDRMYEIKFNLNKELPEPLYAFGVTNSWDGSCYGCSECARNLNECLKFNLGGDHTKVCVEGDKLMRYDVHHDGINIAEFRMVNPNLSNEERCKFVDELIKGNIDAAKEFTVPLGDMVRAVYGSW